MPAYSKPLLISSVKGKRYLLTRAIVRRRRKNATKSPKISPGIANIGVIAIEKDIIFS